MRLGVGSYTYVWGVGVPGYPAPTRPLTVWSILEKARTLGVRVVQIADNLPLHTWTRSELERLSQRADETGIELEIGMLGTSVEELRQYIRIAEVLRSRLIRTVIDTPHERPTSDEVVARLASLGGILQRANLTLAIENHDRLKASALLELLNRIDSDRIGICLDTANSLGCMEGWEKVVEILGPRVVNLHIKDVQVSRLPHHKGFLVEGRPAGHGQVAIPELLARLSAFGVEPNAILELWPPSLPDIEASVATEDAWANQSIQYLRTLIPN